MRTKHTQYAFTLVELLISVSIFAIIGVVLYSSFRGGVLSWRRINAETALQQKIRYVFDRMSEELKNMVFLPNLPFEGSVDDIRFVSLVKSAKGQGVNIARVSYFLSLAEEDTAGGAIVRQEESVKKALSLAAAEENSSGEEAAERRPLKEQNLLDGVTELKLSYLAVYEEGKEGQERECEWLDFWEEEGALPTGVKIELTITNPDDNSTISLSRRICIPLGKPIAKSGGFEEEVVQPVRSTAEGLP